MTAPVLRLATAADQPASITRLQLHRIRHWRTAKSATGYARREALRRVESATGAVDVGALAREGGK